MKEWKKKAPPRTQVSSPGRGWQKLRSHCCILLSTLTRSRVKGTWFMWSRKFLSWKAQDKLRLGSEWVQKGKQEHHPALQSDLVLMTSLNTPVATKIQRKVYSKGLWPQDLTFRPIFSSGSSQSLRGSWGLLHKGSRKLLIWGNLLLGYVLVGNIHWSLL